MWPRTALLVFFLIRQGMPERGEAHCECQSFLLSERLVLAIVQVVSGTPLNAFYVVFQDSPDDCLLSALWESGLGTRLMSVGLWREALESLPYDSASQQLMVGSLTWMSEVLSQASLLMQANRLHAQRTSWIWVLSNTADTARNGTPEHYQDAPEAPRRPLHSVRKNPPPITFTFDYVAEVVNRLSQGMLKGVLLMEQEILSRLPASPLSNRTSTSPLTNSSISEAKRWVHVGEMRARRDWFWEMTLVASYVDHNHTLLNPVWSSLPNDFHGGNIYIAFSQKGATIENTINTNLRDSRGYLADMLKIVMEALNATGVLVLTDGPGTKDASGAWNGIIGVVASGRADIGAVDFTPSQQRMEVVDFSIAIGQDPLIIFSGAPYIIIKPFLIFQIFSLKVWACLGVTVVVGGVVLSWLRRVETSLVASNDEWARLTVNVAIVFKMHLLQSTRGLPPGASPRLFAGLLMLVALCLSSVYSGSITAFLVIPFRSKPINSIEEMLKSKVIPCVRSKTNTVVYSINSPSGALYRVRQRVRVIPGEELETQKYMNEMSQGKYAVIDTLSSSLGRASRFSRRGERCNYHTSREVLQMNLDAIALSRNSRFISQVNTVLMNLQSFGFIQNMKRIYYQPLCVTERKESGPLPLRIVQVVGAFIVLGVGLGLSLGVLMAEVLFMQRL